MDIDVFSSRELTTVLRVLRTALSPTDSLAPRERLFLDTYARITGHALPSADPQRVDASEVQIEGAHQRKRLVQLSALAALLERPPKPASVAFVKALSRQLATPDPAINVLEAVAAGRHLTARLLAMRRGMRALLKEAHGLEGVKGVLRMIGAMLLKAPVNRDKLIRYQRLGLLAEGTLGREYWKHMAVQGFGLPGEPGGIPASLSYHDIAHVLAEHEATPLGEIQQGSFQAGNRREDGFFFIQFVILQFHQGIRVTPGAPPAVDNYDPAKVLWAVHRGAQCKVDMTHRWDFWPLMSLTLQEARESCGLLPKLAGGLGAGHA